jgi:hypothetical protein
MTPIGETMSVPNKTKASPTLSLYLVSFENWEYGEHNCFVVVAYNEKEASQLTPDAQINNCIGTLVSYHFTESEPESVEEYRNEPGTGKSIKRMGDASEEFQWGDVPISSFKTA